MNAEIDSGALVMLVESHWTDFVEYTGNEAEAERTLAILKADCGME